MMFIYLPLLSSLCKPIRRKWSKTYPLLFAVSICSRFPDTPSSKYRLSPAPELRKGKGNIPASGLFITKTTFCVYICKEGVTRGGGKYGVENENKLTGRNPSKILYLLYYDVGISCSEKQLPGTDQSIRYVSYFSKKKRRKKKKKS